jgi:DNA-binding transcriptional LysR family regulator
MPPLIARFVALYPLVRIEMETGLTATMTDRLGKSYDLVLAMHPGGRGGGERVHREQAVWATSPEHAVEALSPLPVALYPQGCLFRQWAIEALDRAKRPWRLAFVSHSLSAVEAIAAQGLAVTVVKRSMFSARLRALSTRDGLPSLPRADICLHRSPALSRAASLFADHVVAGFSRNPVTTRSTGAAGKDLLLGGPQRRRAD